ncbi:hypothetical protein [Thomasclavelia cocleata]|uniref:hypothetical protein n=1 Tax=Thomasclavelia cocleata TaxID=69824 RepID=UPI0024312220|nr:hypothetical protein [Thomasclavelia cocleata]
MNVIESFKEIFVDIVKYILEMLRNIFFGFINFVTENKIGVIAVAPIITGVSVLLIWHYIIKNDNKIKRNCILIYIVEYIISLLFCKKIIEFVNGYLIDGKITEFTYYMLGVIGVVLFIIITTVVYILIIIMLGYDDEI